MVITLLIILIGIRFLIALSPGLKTGAFRIIFVTSLLILTTGVTMIVKKITFVSLILDISAVVVLLAAFSFVIWNLPRLFYDLNTLVSQRNLFYHKFFAVISGPVFFLLPFFIGFVIPDKEIRLNQELTYKERKYRKPIFFPDLIIEIAKIDSSGLLERHFLRKDYYVKSVGYTEIKALFEKGTLYLENFPIKKSRSFEKFKDSININEYNW